LLGLFIITVEILSLGSHIHIEYRAIQGFAGMFFGHNRLLDGIHAANGRAVFVAATVGFSGPDALQPRDLVGLLFCLLFGLFTRWPQQMPSIGSGGRQYTFKFQRGNHIGLAAISIIIDLARVIRPEPRGQNDRPDT